MAATLAAAPGAVASHRSAALLGIPGFGHGGALELTTHRDQRRRRPHAIVHRPRILPAAHGAVVKGVAATRPARTLVDLAGVVPAGRTERAVDNCLAAGLGDDSGAPFGDE